MFSAIVIEFMEGIVVKKSAHRDFITDEHLRAATAHAERLARKQMNLSGFQCAERAVQAVFGSWLLDWSASTKPSCLPLYYQLISIVENRLDLHRRPKERTADPVPPLPQCSQPPGPLGKPVIARAALALAA